MDSLNSKPFDDASFNNEILVKDLKDINQKIENLKSELKLKNNKGSHQVIKRQLVQLLRQKKEIELQINVFESKQLSKSLVSYQQPDSHKFSSANNSATSSNSNSYKSPLLHHSNSSFTIHYGNSPEIVNTLETISDALSGDFVPTENENLQNEYGILLKEFTTNPISLESFFN